MRGAEDRLLCGRKVEKHERRECRNKIKKFVRCREKTHKPDMYIHYNTVYKPVKNVNLFVYIGNTIRKIYVVVTVCIHTRVLLSTGLCEGGPSTSLSQISL